jgi:hypothetical protein
MSDGNSESQKPVKKSEILAIENVKRIANQIRSERNDALALAQIMRERVDHARSLLEESKIILSESRGTVELVQRVDEFLAETDRQ